ncbi:MAG: hypothetical protein ABIP68_07160 [Ferruginibacter sp.]
MTYEIEFKVTGLDEQSYNSIIELLKTIEKAEITSSQNDGKPIVSSSVPYKENWNPDWKGDPDDPQRCNGW